MVPARIEIGVLGHEERQVQRGIAQRHQMRRHRRRPLVCALGQQHHEPRPQHSAQTSGPASITSFQNGTSRNGPPGSDRIPASSSPVTSSTKSPIATPQRGSSPATENTPQGRLFSGNSASARLALSTQDRRSGIFPAFICPEISHGGPGCETPGPPSGHFTPGVPSNFFSRDPQQSM